MQSNRHQKKNDAEISKSAVKRQMLELQELGEKIVALPEAQFKNISLNEKLFDAVSAARKITKHGGLKRQLQYIGKLMRHVDPEPIRQAIAEIEDGHQQESRLFHLKEQWRDDLIMDDNKKLSEFIEMYPSTDLQRLRQLIRGFRNAKNDDKKKQTARLLFQLISEQISVQ